MRSLLFLAPLMASALSAATLCSSSSPQDVMSLNAAGGCSIGGLTFSNFMVEAASGNPNPQIDLFSAWVDPSGVVNLGFNPNMSAPPSGGFQDIHFFFTVTGGINQIDLGIGGVNATINEVACATSMTPNSPVCGTEDVLANIIAYSAPPGPNSSISSAFRMTNTVYIYKDIGVSPDYPNGTGGGLTAFTQSFHTGGLVPDAPVPEPLSMSLCGLGLLAIGLKRRSMRKA